MSTLSATSTRRCYACFRPAKDCFCDTIPAIDNRTNILILQHKRERFHRFGTARIVNRALRNSELSVGLDGRFEAGLGLKPGAALLYPGPESELLDELSPLCGAMPQAAEVVTADYESQWRAWSAVRSFTLRFVDALPERKQVLFSRSWRDAPESRRMAVHPSGRQAACVRDLPLSV